MREQTGFHEPGTPTLSRPVRSRSSSSSTGHYAGLHGEDMQTTRTDSFPDATVYDFADEEEDEGARTRTSTRRYVAQSAPRTVMRVTTHQGRPPIARASSMQQQQQRQLQQCRTDTVAPLARRKQTRLAHHWLVYAGGTLLIMLFGWMLLSMVERWWSGLQDDWQYGKPRTAQVDRNVGHGGVSHFTIENLQGHILVTEVQIDAPAKAKIYVGPTLSGSGSDLAPATLTFEDVNGDGLPDMIITVDNTKYTFVNSKDGHFHPLNGGGTA